MSGAFRSNKPRGNSKRYSDLGASKGQYLDRSKKFLTNIKLKGINELPRRKQRGIKDHNGQNPSPQGAGYSPGRK